jgi:hypothetical protein
MREPESAAERTERLVCALPGCDEDIPLHTAGLHLYHSKECRDEARRLGLGPDTTGESVLEELPAVRVDGPPRTKRAYRGVAAVVAGVGALAVGGGAIVVWPEEEYRLAPIAQEAQPPVSDSYDTGELLPQPLLPPSANEPTRTRPQAPPVPPAPPPVVETTTTQRTVRPSPAPYIPSVRYNFERGFQGWDVFWDEGNLDIDAPDAPAFAGQGALMMSIAGGGYAAVGVDSTAIPSSATVTYYVYSDGSGDGYVQPIVFDQADQPYLPTGEIALPARKGYFRVSFKTPKASIAAIGLEVFSFSDELQVGLDSVSW